jgi:hypothetical protein
MQPIGETKKSCVRNAPGFFRIADTMFNFRIVEKLSGCVQMITSVCIMRYYYSIIPLESMSYTKLQFVVVSLAASAPVGCFCVTSVLSAERRALRLRMQSFGALSYRPTYCHHLRYPSRITNSALPHV